MVCCARALIGEIGNVGEKRRALIAEKLFEYGFNNYSKFSFMVKSKERVYNGK